jgi:3-hydroxyisobutyrate dehydrogenase
MEKIGFIGLGNMGQGMAKNIQKAGYPMMVLDVKKDAEKDLVAAGAKSANTPAEIAKECDVIITMLPGPKEVEETSLGKDGLLSTIKAGAIYVDMSSSSASLIRKLAVDYAKKGAHACDGPVSGGVGGANSGTLSIMFGGEKAIYDKVEAVMKRMGSKILYCGDVGTGCVCKAAHNMFMVIAMQGLAEAFTLAVKAGVEPKAAFEAMRNGGMGRNAILHTTWPMVVFKDKFEPPLFALSLAIKDLKLATETGRDYKVPLTMANMAEQILVEAVNRGWAGKDWGTMVLLQEEAAGVKVRVPDIDTAEAAKFVIFNPDVRK